MIHYDQGHFLSRFYRSIIQITTQYVCEGTRVNVSSTEDSSSHQHVIGKIRYLLPISSVILINTLVVFSSLKVFRTLLREDVIGLLSEQRLCSRMRECLRSTLGWYPLLVKMILHDGNSSSQSMPSLPLVDRGGCSSREEGHNWPESSFTS